MSSAEKMSTGGRAVPVLEALVIEEVATWVSEVVTESLTTWVKHANAMHAAAGVPTKGVGGGKKALGAASVPLRMAVSDLTSSLSAWMDGLAERRDAMSAHQAGAIAIERALRMHGTLAVRVRYASDLPPASPGADAVTEIAIRGMERRTQPARGGGASPSWDQTLKFEGQLGELIERPIIVRVRRAAAAAAVAAALSRHRPPPCHRPATALPRVRDCQMRRFTCLAACSVDLRRHSCKVTLSAEPSGLPGCARPLLSWHDAKFAPSV
jgi:hypothetical protein